MTIVRTLVLVGVAAVEGITLVACGVSLLAAGGWLLAQIGRRYGSNDVPIAPPQIRFGKLSPADVDALRARAASRRQWVDERRTEERAIASGEPPRTITLLVRRR